MMKYCTKCVMPNTRPKKFFNKEGICGACLGYKNRKNININNKKTELIKILDKYRSKDGSNWDCIIPVSGGKDSTYQVIQMLNLKMNPLCIIATTCHLSSIGRKNIENLKNLGVDCIEFSPNPVVRRKLNRIGLIELGDISWPEHAGIFTIPIRTAIQLKIPLLIWGENGQNEYGKEEGDSESTFMDQNFVDNYAFKLGHSIHDLAKKNNINKKQLITYVYPSQKEIEKANITGLFLGNYIPWDGYSNALFSQAYGLTTNQTAVEGSLTNYENLDNYQTGIHDYFMFLKFGYGRTNDLACLHIRRKRISRNDAVDIVNQRDGKFPWTYLGKPIEEILKPLEISLDEFIKICDKFTNKKIFKTDSKGNIVKNKDGNLIKKYPLKKLIPDIQQIYPITNKQIRL
jgi:N-acetyl sugar amidotransferase